MKKGLLAIALLSITTAFAAAGLWKNDKAHSQLQFTIAHLGLNDVSGTFNDFEVTVSSSKADFSDAVITLDAKVASIDTRIEARDNHLKSADFFNADKFSNITFKSTGLKKAGKNTYKLTGNLTMHGVTKPVTMDWIVKGNTVNPMSNAAITAFQLKGAIKRSDFNIGSTFPEVVLSDIVQIKADGEFTK